MANQIDLGPNNPTGLHIHVPAGISASAANSPSDFPTPSVKGGTQVTVKVAGVRFASPS